LGRFNLSRCTRASPALPRPLPASRPAV
jgi:hypothetical protein